MCFFFFVQLVICREDFNFKRFSCSGACSAKDCDVNAQCSSKGSKVSCSCKQGYEGNGKVCIPINPCSKANGLCPFNSTYCVFNGPNKVWKSDGIQALNKRETDSIRVNVNLNKLMRRVFQFPPSLCFSLPVQLWMPAWLFSHSRQRKVRLSARLHLCKRHVSLHSRLQNRTWWKSKVVDPTSLPWESK